MKQKLLALLLALTLLLSLSSCVIRVPDGKGPGWEDIFGGLFDAPGNGTTGICQVKEDHTDENTDGVCDICATDVTVTLDLYAVNDLHGKFCDSNKQPGVDELTTYLQNAETRDEEYILLSTGDMWQGSAESNSTKGALLTDWMNELEFVSMTLGNHEYDWGASAIDDNAALSEFPFLAINVYDRETNKRAAYCEPSVMVTRGELVIGIIGAIGDCYSSISSDQVEDVYFKVGSELTALVKAESQRLREAGADYIVYSLHDGHGSSSGSIITDSALSSYYDPALSKGGYVDLVFEGHTHQHYVLRDTYGVYHLQGGGDNVGLSHAEVEINFVTDTGVVNTAEYVPAEIYSATDSAPLSDALLLKYDALIAPTRRVVGENATYRTSDTLAQITADLYYEFGVRTWGDRYDIALGGGFIKLRSPYVLYAGEVIYADLLMILPFDNQLVLCSISGYNLNRRFLQTTNSNYYIGTGDTTPGDVDPNATYYVVVDSYTAQYAPNGLTVVETYPEDYFARDLLADYISAGGME